MVIRYSQNRAGLAAFERSPQMVTALERVLAPIKQHAEVNTPVDTGRMRASWRIHGGVAAGRAFARISNSARSETGAPYPAYLEFGTRRIKRRRILARAIDANKR